MAAKDCHSSMRLEAKAPVGPQLFRLLRDRIVRCEMKPGTRLSEADVAKSYGTSRGSVREAFIKLAEASLIEVLPQRGSYVSRIDVASVLAARFIREAVEADIVRCIAQTVQKSAVDELEAILALQAEAVDIDDPQPFMTSDEAFHRKLSDLAGQGAGWDFLQPTKTQMDRVRHLTAQQFPRRILLQQHREIVEAIKQGDADTAEQKMRHHLRRILDDVPVVTDAHPDYFESEQP